MKISHSGFGELTLKYTWATTITPIRRASTTLEHWYWDQKCIWSKPYLDLAPRLQPRLTCRWRTMLSKPLAHSTHFCGTCQQDDPIVRLYWCKTLLDGGLIDECLRYFDVDLIIEEEDDYRSRSWWFNLNFSGLIQRISPNSYKDIEVKGNGFKNALRCTIQSILASP